LIDAAGELVVNLHASLLPRFRGAAPIQHAILAGERETGVSVISLAARMDAGLIYAQAATPISPTETAGELHDRLALLGPDVVDQVLRDFEAGQLRGRSQDETHVSRAGKLSRADAAIDFAQPADLVCRQIRAMSPWPGVAARWRPNRPMEPGESGGGPQATCADLPAIKLLRAQAIADREAGAAGGAGLDEAKPGVVTACGQRLIVAAGSGWVELLEVQPEGRRGMSAAAFCQGHPVRIGDRFEPLAD
jgi:methionyl-tRNA formyltransferase